MSSKLITFAFPSTIDLVHLLLGLFEFLVMPFRLTNGPASFQHYINDALLDYLEILCTTYLDGILIYSNSLSEYRKHVRQILQRLREFELQADIEKCEFYV